MESIRFKGIYGLEKLECGCQIKHYKGGKTILEASYKCTLEPRHITTVKHVCVNCGFEGTKLELKQHKWTHAYDA